MSESSTVATMTAGFETEELRFRPGRKKSAVDRTLSKGARKASSVPIQPEDLTQP